MRGKISVFLVLGFLLGCFIVHADITTRAPLYRTIIEKEIARCQQKVDLVHSRGENLRLSGRKAAERAAFYQHRKQQLVRDMVEESIAMKPYTISYFLIKAFKDHGPDARLATSQRPPPQAVSKTD